MISSTKLSDTIIEKAKSLGASIAGIADVELLKNSPSHRIYPQLGVNIDGTMEGKKNSAIRWPEDAVSVVVIGIEHNAGQPELDWWDGKGTPGNRLLIEVNSRLSEWITDTYSINTYRLPYFVEKGGIFLKDAAVHAGLGCIGKNNLLITPEHGPRIRLRALLLDREVTPTGFTEFNPCEQCEQFCRKECPIKAFQNTVYSSEIFGQNNLPGNDGTYDRVCCNKKMEKDIDDAARVLSTEDDDQQEIRQLIAQLEKSHIRTPDVEEPIQYCVKYCRKCELSCPVGFK